MQIEKSDVEWFISFIFSVGIQIAQNNIKKKRKKPFKRRRKHK